jgi:hypothetical protein
MKSRKFDRTANNSASTPAHWPDRLRSGRGLITTSLTVNRVYCEQMSPALAPWLLVRVCAANLHVYAQPERAIMQLPHRIVWRVHLFWDWKTANSLLHTNRQQLQQPRSQWLDLLGTIALWMTRPELEAKGWECMELHLNSPTHIFMSLCLPKAQFTHTHRP